MNRRSLLKSMAMTGAAASLQATARVAAPAGGNVRFIHFTDTHIQPELNAAQGVAMCVAKLQHEPADFAIHGGDLVMDALAVDKMRSHMVFDLYKSTTASLHLPVHYVMGNHDVLGLLPASGVSPSDPEYGRKYFQDHFGPTHYSFDHGGWHFVVIDSIGLRPDRSYWGQIGEEQRAWLRSDLERNGRQKPVIVVTHIPLVTGAINYVSHKEWLQRTGNMNGLIDTLMVSDAAETIDILLDYNVRAVLQGHTHVNEDITFRGIRFITSGAVSGNWWKGVRAGSAEGYSVYTLTPGGGVHQEYKTYGFHAVTS